MQGFLYCLLYLAVVAATSNPLGLLIPRKCFNPWRFPFKIYGFEKNGDIYLRVGIRKWKTRVPDMSRINRRMAPKQIASRPKAEDVLLLLQEGCRAECVHWTLMLLSIPCIFLWDGIGGIAWTTVYALGNLPFVMIQRYNRPRQLALYSALKKQTEIGE